MKLKEEIEEITEFKVKHKDFSKWSKENLVEFLENVRYNCPEMLEFLLECYDEWMRGN